MKHTIPCDHCEKLTTKWTHQLETNRKNYCCRACKDAALTKYSIITLCYVLAYFGKRPFRSLAKMLNVSPYGLRLQITKWRNEGYAIKAPGRGRAITTT